MNATGISVWAIAGILSGAGLLAGCGGQAATQRDTEAETPAAMPRTVNRVCPIMNSPFDPAKVPAHLTAEFEGQKVGFCCGGCVPAWNGLTDAEKRAKLNAALGATPAPPPAG
jgi:hypothetical protein